VTCAPVTEGAVAKQNAAGRVDMHCFQHGQDIVVFFGRVQVQQFLADVKAVNVRVATSTSMHTRLQTRGAGGDAMSKPTKPTLQ